MFVALIASAIFAVAGVLTASPVAQNRNAIEGQVTTPDRRGLASLPVFLLNDAYGQKAQTYTDGSGRYYFRNLSAGNYYVQVEPGGTGYARQTQRVEVNPYAPAGGGSEIFRVDIVLKSETTNRPGGSHPELTPGANLVVFAQDVPSAAREAYQRGEQSLSKNDLKTAEINLVRAIELFPDYYEALELLGSEYVKHDFFDSALPLLNHAVEINRNAWHSYYGLGVSLIELGKRTEGLDALRRAVRINPRSVNAAMRLGLELEKDERFADEAIEQLTNVTRLAGKRLPDAYLALASLYSKKKQYREAADALEEYLRFATGTIQREDIKRKIQDLRQKSANELPNQ